MISRLVVAMAVLVLSGGAQTAWAQTAKARYDQALAREQDLRGASPQPPARIARQVIRAYEEIARKFPTSGYTDDALWRAGRLAADAFEWHKDRFDQQTSERLLRWLIREYPHSSHIKAAADVLAEAAAANPLPATRVPAARTPAAAPRTVATTEAEPPAGAPPADAARRKDEDGTRTGATIRSIRRSLLDSVERIVVELDSEISYSAQELARPARVFFDLQHTTVAKDLLSTIQEFDTDLVRRIRIGRHPNAVTRLVLELDRRAPYSVFTLYNPYRLVVDFARPTTLLASASAPPPVAAPAEPPPIVAAAVAPASPHPVPTPAPRKSRSPKPPAVPVPLEGDVPHAVIESERAPVPTPDLPNHEPAADGLTFIEGTSLALGAMPKADLATPSAPVPSAPTPAAAAPPATPTPTSSVPAVAENVPPSTAPGPAPVPPASNVAGGFSLARQLGLGVGRIVIDPGHGGHDPGAIAGGLTESAVVLDIALRLEKLLQEDGTFDVVMTRRSNSFIPLEERTAIANRANADLFLSIHVNSSRNQTARGIETYYLNFASDKDAEAVAARENSASGQTMRNLTGIVQAIALNTKLDESRDFAATVQTAIVKRVRQQTKLTRDLGVKRAPFVVLIGASMPSVLAEVAFISNPQERQLLKSATYKQRMAQALFDAIQQYQRSLKAVTTVAQQ